MSSGAFPGSSYLMKGAIVGIDIFNPVASTTVFQYNPNKLTRSLTPRFTDIKDSPDFIRFRGPPEETISLDLVIDSTDQKENDTLLSHVGIYPQLSALEMLVYPKSLQVGLNLLKLKAGKMEVIPPVGPLTFFIWGPSRILPVTITKFTITETLYDNWLNPIRADVSMTLRVLSYSDLSVKNPGFYVFLAHQVAKEIFAVTGTALSLHEGVTSLIPSI